jgi:hypothetical protein
LSAQPVPVMSAHPVQVHLRRLLAAPGVTARTVQAATGIPAAVLLRIRADTTGRCPRVLGERILACTTEAVLRVADVDPTIGDGQDLWGRLMANGWPLAYLTIHGGQAGAQPWWWDKPRGAPLGICWWARAFDVYYDLHLRAGPDDETRARARADGYRPPLAYGSDGRPIPRVMRSLTEKPATARVRRGQKEREAAHVDRWLTLDKTLRGLTASTIAVHLGVVQRTVDRYRDELGLAWDGDHEVTAPCGGQDDMLALCRDALTEWQVSLVDPEVLWEALLTHLAAYRWARAIGHLAFGLPPLVVTHREPPTKRRGRSTDRDATSPAA